MTTAEMEAEIAYRIQERLGILSQGGPITPEMQAIAAREANQFKILHSQERRQKWTKKGK